MLTSLRPRGVRIPRMVPHLKSYSSGKPPKPTRIDEFNKSKTTYSYGHNFSSLDELDSKLNPERTPVSERSGASSDIIHERIRQNFEQEQEENINNLLENDPRLLVLDKGTPDYKHMLNQVHEEYIAHQKQQRQKYEFREKVKGAGVGLLLLISIIVGHQVLTNYDYVRGKFNSKFVNPLGESKATDLSDPKKNTKNLDYLLDKLSSELDDATIAGIKDSAKESGLYLVGASNNKKLPVRLSFFDGMLIKDVKLLNDYLVVINEKGQIYHFHAKTKEPVLTKLPFKAQSCTVSNDLIYVLTDKGEVVYIPRLDKADNSNFEPISSSRFFGLLTPPQYNKIANQTEPFTQISSGESHLLLLGKSGKVYISNTRSSKAMDFKNLGQFGLPIFSPLLDKKEEIPVNKAYEVTLLNNEVYKNKDGSKSLRFRKFTSIASGKYHNIVADNSGNVWTWGQNIHGECGIDITYKTDYQPIPKKVTTEDDYKRLTSSFLPKTSKANDFRVTNVYASDETSYVQISYDDKEDEQRDQELLVSFGNGIKGQLGSNKYLHVCSKPQLVKSISNLQEYDEESNKLRMIDIKNVSVGNNHIFVTLNNSGSTKDVLAFGDNEFGQLGNGKRIKSCKPGQIPKLVEPKDVSEEGSVSKETQRKRLAKRLSTVINSRLQLLDGQKLANGKVVEQVIVAGENGSAIFYKSK